MARKLTDRTKIKKLAEALGDRIILMDRKMCIPAWNRMFSFDKDGCIAQVEDFQ